ncbi:CBS domain-containing protein [bacterium]|nr:CBS domain-containing protein [bacterium]
MSTSPKEDEESYHDKKRVRGAILAEQIRSLRPPAAIAVRPQASVLEAIQLMNRSRQGCVCVTEGERLVGIFTERDILTKVLEQGLDIKKTRVSELMTRNPEILTPEDSIAIALNRMHVGGFRNIPIVQLGKLVGLISLRDIADFLVEMFPESVLNVLSDSSLGIPTRPDGG